MTLFTNRNYIKPVLRGVAFVVVIIFCLIRTIIAKQSIGSRQFSFLNCYVYRTTGFKFLEIVFAIFALCIFKNISSSMTALAYSAFVTMVIFKNRNTMTFATFFSCLVGFFISFIFFTLLVAFLDNFAFITFLIFRTTDFAIATMTIFTLFIFIKFRVLSLRLGNSESGLVCLQIRQVFIMICSAIFVSLLDDYGQSRLQFTRLRSARLIVQQIGGISNEKNHNFYHYFFNI